MALGADAARFGDGCVAGDAAGACGVALGIGAAFGLTRLIGAFYLVEELGIRGVITVRWVCGCCGHCWRLCLAASRAGGWTRCRRFGRVSIACSGLDTS